MKRTTLLSVFALVAGGILAFGAVAAAGAQTQSFNVKFEFSGAEVDGVIPGGTIYGASKQSGPEHNLKQLTNCTYFDAEYNFLGYYAAPGFASIDADDVLLFCLENFENRWI